MDRKYIIFAILATLLLAACGGEADVPVLSPEDESDEPIFSSWVGIDVRQGRECVDWQPEIRKATRAEGDEDDEDSTPPTPTLPPIPAAVPQTMGVFSYNNNTSGQFGSGYGQVFDNQLMTYAGAGNPWDYTPKKKWLGAGTLYKFFAYSPHTSRTGLPTTVNGLFGYNSFSTFEWYGIPRYSKDDYIIAWNVKRYTALGANNIVQRLDMRHLYSRLRFCFKLHEKFGDRRKILVKGMGIKSLRGKVNLTVNNLDNVPEVVMVQSLEGDTYATTLNNDPETVEDGGVWITAQETQYKPLASLYAYTGSDLNQLTISVTYDVYDVEGQKLRVDQTAENTIVLNLKKEGTEAGEGMRVLEMGKYYNINITVNPDYLYALDDNDFDADGEIVIR